MPDATRIELDSVKQLLGCAGREPQNVYHTESVYKVVLQKSIPAQIRQLILYISNSRQ